MKHRPPITPLELSPQQIEALRQLANLGSSDAARSLGRLLGTSVEAAQPRAQVAPRGSVERVLQPFIPRYKGTGFYSTDHRKPTGDAGRGSRPRGDAGDSGRSAPVSGSGSAPRESCAP